MTTPEIVTNEPMYCLFAPDGNWQPNTLSVSFPACAALLQLMAAVKMCLPFDKLRASGFQILPVSVTAVVTGDENTAFQR